MHWDMAERMVGVLPQSKLRIWCLYVRPLHSSLPSGVIHEDENLSLCEHFPESAPGLALGVLQADEADDGCFSRHNRQFIGKSSDAYVFRIRVFVNDRNEPAPLRLYTNMKVNVALPPNWIYLWDGFTAECERGKGYMPAFINALCGRFAAENRIGAAALININNGASRRAIAKSGFARVALLTHLRVLGRDLILSSYRISEQLPGKRQP
jgi:hypothetical protein